jgi:hypothetical protein
MEKSQFQFYSFGIVAVNKLRNSDKIFVTPMEHLPVQDGGEQSVTVGKGQTKYKSEDKVKAIHEQKTTYSSDVPDSRGIVRSTTVRSDVMIEAQWMALSNSNRVTAPDVMKGENVILMRMADTDKFWWTTTHTERGIRRLETVLYMFGNLAKGLIPWKKETSYFMQVSTHDKHIHLHTSKSDGEPYEYDFYLDTRNGNFTVKDDIGNNIVLDSKQSKITFNALKTIEVNTQTVNVNASASTTITCPTNTITGKLHVGGAVTTGSTLTTAAAISSGGGISAAGGGSFGGGGSFAGSVSAPNIR